MIEDSSAKNIKAGAMLTYITQFLSIAISFVYVPIMLGKLGQAEYGLYSIVQTLITYLQMSELGIGTTATRYNSKYIGENNVTGQKTINGMFFKLYLGIALFCVLLSVVLYVFLDNIYASYSTQSIQLIKSLFIIAVINLVITFVFKIFNAIILAYEDFIFVKMLSLIQTILGPVGMLIVLFLGFRSIGMLWVTTGLSLIFGLIQMLFCLKKYKIRFDLKAKDKTLFKKIFSFTIFVFINSLATQFMLNSDKIVISIIINETAVAIYAIVLQFHTYSYNFSNVLSGFYLPKFTKTIAAEKVITKDINDEMIKIARIQIVISGLIFGGFLAIGYPFIIKWVGVEYSSAYLLTVILLFTEVIGSTQSTFNSLMQAMNLHKTRALLSVAVTLVKIVFTIIGTYFFGLLGCAIAFLIGWAIKQIVFNIYYYKVGVDIKTFWKNVIKILLPIAVIVTVLYVATFFALKVLPATSYLVIITYAIIYVVLYFLAMWFTAFNEDEKSSFKRLLKREKGVKDETSHS